MAKKPEVKPTPKPRASKSDAQDEAFADAVTAHIRGDIAKRKEAVGRLLK